MHSNREGSYLDRGAGVWLWIGYLGLLGDR